MTDPRSRDFDELLAETGWVRRLARRLAGDPDLGDDLAQDAWVVALERPPRDERPLGPWLAGILRHLTPKARRGAARRAGRERDAARAGVAPPTDELVERAALHRDLVEAVMGLDEPYRTAILMRYLEELPPREIAARLDVPVRTVHTRIARGLEHLRRRLDRRHRGSWAAVLLSPLARPPVRALASSTGLLVMTTKWLQIAAALVLVVVFGAYGTLGWLLPERPEDVAETVPNRILAAADPAPLTPPGDSPTRAEIAAEPVPSSLVAPDADRDLHGVRSRPSEGGRARNERWRR